MEKQTIKFTWSKGNMIITPPQQYEVSPIQFLFPIEIDYTYQGVGGKWKFADNMITLHTTDDDEQFFLKLTATKMAREKLIEMNAQPINN